MFKPLGFLVLLGALSIAPLAGCYTNSKGITSCFGTYSTPVSATPDQAIAAAREVAREMNLTEVIFSSTSVDGKLIATSADERTFEFTTSKKGDRVSDLAIRVGSTGDKEMSYQLIDKIKVKL